ncbi:MAG: ABC transporter permease [Clostridiaceae bacterium]|nr:ABC transporter permease [Clostridiaceae bacterium]
MREIILIKTFKAFIIPLLLLALWWLGSTLEFWNSYVLPEPARVFGVFIRMLWNGELAEHILISLRRVVTGFSIAFFLAFVLGILAGMSSKKAAYYDAIVEFLRHVPPLSLIPLLILWFGIGEKSKIIVIILASFFPMFLNIKKGIAFCDKKLLEVGDIFGFSDFKKFYKIMLPYALPDILVGMRIGFGYSWRAIIGAEMIAAASGLGYMILDAQQMSRSDKIIVGIFAIGLMGVLCDKLAGVIIKKFIHGGEGNGSG